MNWIDAGIVGYLAFVWYRCAIEHMADSVIIMAIALVIWTWLAIYINERTTSENV